MPLVQLVVLLVLVGVGLFLLRKYVPMPAGWMTLIYIVVGIVVVLFLLKLFGLMPNLNALRVG